MLTNSIIKTKEKQHAEMGRLARGDAIERGKTILPACV